MIDALVAKAGEFGELSDVEMREALRILRRLERRMAGDVIKRKPK
jgi:hypothetical protein